MELQSQFLMYFFYFAVCFLFWRPTAGASEGLGVEHFVFTSKADSLAVGKLSLCSLGHKLSFIWCVKYWTITDNNSIKSLTFSYASKCLPLSILLKHLSWICSTLDIYCTSVRPGRGIPHMWLSLRFLRSFYPVKSVFCSFSLLLLRVKGRGCHTMLKPYETNCDLWIWAIQIKFDWLIIWNSPL